MKYTVRIIISIAFLFSFSGVKSQNSHNIESNFSLDDLSISVKQKSNYVNQTSNKLSNIIIYDWNNSYSSIDSPLSKKLYSEYDSSILKSIYTFITSGAYCPLTGKISSGVTFTLYINPSVKSAYSPGKPVLNV